MKVATHDEGIRHPKKQKKEKKRNLDPTMKNFEPALYSITAICNL